MSVSHGGVSDEAFPRRHRNKRYGWVVITPELFTDTTVSQLPIAARWAYLQGLAESALRGEPRMGDGEYADCGVILTQRRQWPQRVRQAIYDRDGNACLRCGTSERLVLDHIKPLARGGADDPSNLQTLCHPCNSRKWAHYP